LSTLKSFSFKSKGKELISSAHLFHSERDATKLISKTLDCTVPNPQILQLQDDQTFSLEPRVHFLELKEAKELQLHDNKTLLSEARSLAIRVTPGGSGTGAINGDGHEDRAGGFAPYLWSEEQEMQRQNGLHDFVPYIPGRLLRPRLRNMSEFKPHEKMVGINQMEAPNDSLINTKTYFHFINMKNGIEVLTNKLGSIKKLLKMKQN
jgi:hypothetical protein